MNPAQVLSGKAASSAVMQGGPSPPQPAAPRPAPPSGKPAPPAPAQKSKRRYWDVAIIIIVVTAIAAWQLIPKTTSIQIPPGPGGLAGYVFADAASNYRVSGAVIEIDTENNTYSTTVGSFGEYTISGIPSGHWVARVKVAGTTRATENIAIIGMIIKEWTNIAPELVPNGSTDGVSVFYGPHGWGAGGAYR
ncbi:MAG: hypothetical protein AB1476_00935 [Candidatus Hadarchaeota archaeon]